MVRIENGLAASVSAGMIVAHQLVATLDALVAVDVGAHRHVLAAPGRPAQLPAQHLADVGLDHDLRVEVVARVEVEVLVRLAGEAVVADHAVGDEVSRSGGDVEHRDLDPQVLHLHHVQLRAGLDREARQVAFPRDGGVGQLEEPHALGQPAGDPHRPESVGLVVVLDHVGQPQCRHRLARAGDDLVVRVAYPEHATGVRALGVEDAREEALAPGVGGRGRPLDERRHGGVRVLTARPDRRHRAVLGCRGCEGESRRGDAEPVEVAPAPVQRLLVNQREPEAVDLRAGAARPRVVVDTQRTVPADHAGQISPPVVGVLLRRFAHRAESEQGIARRQVGAPGCAAHRPDDVLPAPFGEEAVVTAGDQPRAVGQRQSVGALDGLPMVPGPASGRSDEPSGPVRCRRPSRPPGPRTAACPDRRTSG